MNVLHKTLNIFTLNLRVSCRHAIFEVIPLASFGQTTIEVSFEDVCQSQILKS